MNDIPTGQPQGWQPPTGQGPTPPPMQPTGSPAHAQPGSPAAAQPVTQIGPTLPHPNYPYAPDYPYAPAGRGAGGVPPWSPGWAPGWAPDQPVPPRMPTSVLPQATAATPPRKSHRFPAFLVATLMVVAAGVGIGIGHLAWPQQTSSAGPVALSSGSDGTTSNGTTPDTTTPDQNGTGSGGSTDPNGTGGTDPNGTGGTDPNGTGGTDPNGTGGTDPNGTGGTDPNGTGGSDQDPLGGLPDFGNIPGLGTIPGFGDGSGGGSTIPGFGDGSGGTDPNGTDPNGTDPNGTGGGSTIPGFGGSTGSGSTEGEGAPDDVSGIADKVDDSLAIINVTFSYQGAAGAGTGIVLTSDGEVLTNNHVIDGATSISVTDLGNGKSYGASVVGYSKSNDIAVLQLENASGLATATIADSSKVKVGDPVVGIGNAGGTGSATASGGSVTRLNQSITVSDELYGTTATLSGLIEVNANIQSGDSGGSLVNADGKVIGVDTAAAASNGQSATSQGYAVPINTAMAIVKQIESGTSTDTVHAGKTAALGVLVTSSGSTTSGMPGLGGSGSGSGTTEGAEVQSVVDGGAAAKAGVDAGSVITKLDGHAISSSEDLSELMLTYHPGDKVSLTWTDSSGQSHTETVTLGTGPAA